MRLLLCDQSGIDGDTTRKYASPPSPNIRWQTATSGTVVALATVNLVNSERAAYEVQNLADLLQDRFGKTGCVCEVG
jgi:hypothetical protein